MGEANRALHLPGIADGVPDQWEWSHLDEVAEVIDCHHSTPVLTHDGPFVIRSQDMRSGVIDLSGAGRVSEETYQERISRVEPQYGDLLYSREGTYFGIAAEVPPDTRLCLGQRMVLLRPSESDLNSRFLCYWLNSSIMGRHIHGFRDGTVAERLNMSTIRELPVVLPPLEEQRAIAHILGSLDDKIEANRRMNEALEATARAIFKSWFVDFDPVHEKSRGEQPVGMDAATADLFPDSFEDSALGEIPAGWGVATLGDISEKPQYGFTASAQDEDVGPKFLRITDINKRPWINWETVPYCEASEAEYEKFGVEYGDILIARMADPGHAAFIEEDVFAVFASYLIRFRPKIEGYDRYLQYWLRSQNYWDQANGAKTGTTRSSLNAQVLSKFKLVVPTQDLCEAFSYYVTPLRREITAKNAESRTLAETRDALLPKLVSGEVRVGEVDG